MSKQETPQTDQPIEQLNEEPKNPNRNSEGETLEDTIRRLKLAE